MSGFDKIYDALNKFVKCTMSDDGVQFLDKQGNACEISYDMKDDSNTYYQIGAVGGNPNGHYNDGTYGLDATEAIDMAKLLVKE